MFQVSRSVHFFSNFNFVFSFPFIFIHSFSFIFINFHIKFLNTFKCSLPDTTQINTLFSPFPKTKMIPDLCGSRAEADEVVGLKRLLVLKDKRIARGGLDGEPEFLGLHIDSELIDDLS